MAAAERLICASGDLPEQGRGVRFHVEAGGRIVPAFAIRFRGRVHGYLNRCGHVPVELDFQEGEFFDETRLYLACSTHGARYDPATGQCLGGRCAGRGLQPLPLVEHDDGIYLNDLQHG